MLRIQCLKKGAHKWTFVLLQELLERCDMFGVCRCVLRFAEYRQKCTRRFRSFVVVRCSSNCNCIVIYLRVIIIIVVVVVVGIVRWHWRSCSRRWFIDWHSLLCRRRWRYGAIRRRTSSFARRRRRRTLWSLWRQWRNAATSTTFDPFVSSSQQFVIIIIIIIVIIIVIVSIVIVVVCVFRFTFNVVVWRLLVAVCWSLLVRHRFCSWFNRCRTLLFDCTFKSSSVCLSVFIMLLNQSNEIRQ